MTLPRRRTLVLSMLAVLLVALTAWWWIGRDQVAWSVEVDGAERVVDADDEHVLVETSLDRLVVLEREDGDVTTAVDLPSDQTLLQGVLLPDGGLVAAWDGDDTSIRVARFDRDGRELWTRDGERVMGVSADGAVIAVLTSGADGAMLGVGPGGEERWRRAAPQGVQLQRASGREAGDVHVTVTRTPDGGHEVVDIGDGRVLGTLDTGTEALEELAFSSDAVLARLADGTLRLSAAGQPVDLGGDDVTGAGLLGHVAGGVVAVPTDTGWFGVDLEAATARRFGTALDRAYDSVHDRRLVGVEEDGEIAILDVATGEASATYDAGSELLSQTSGPDGVLVIEDPGRLGTWRHLLSRDDAGRLTVVDADGERHGSWVTTEDLVDDMVVVDEHEALVITSGSSFDEDPEPTRVTLLGR